MLRCLFLAAAVASLVGMDARLATGQTQADQSLSSLDFSFVDLDPCTGELVAIEGTTYANVQYTTNGNQAIAVTHFRTEGIGYGLDSGNPYIYLGNEQHVQVIGLPFTVVAESIEQRFRVICQGGADDFFLTLRFKMILNANGDVVVELEDSEIECR